MIIELYFFGSVMSNNAYPERAGMDTEREHLIDIITQKTFRDGDKVKLPCAAAFTIAEQNGVNIADIGSVCNELNIRICKCQLGCFE